MKIERQWLSLKEAAVWLNISYDKIMDMVKKREIDFCIIGKRKMIRITYLENWCEKRTIRATK